MAKDVVEPGDPSVVRAMVSEVGNVECSKKAITGKLREIRRTAREMVSQRKHVRNVFELVIEQLTKEIEEEVVHLMLSAGKVGTLTVAALVSANRDNRPFFRR